MDFAAGVIFRSIRASACGASIDSSSATHTHTTVVLRVVQMGKVSPL